MAAINSYHFHKCAEPDTYEVSITLRGKFANNMQLMRLYVFTRICSLVAEGVEERYKEFSNKDLYRDLHSFSKNTIEYFKSKGDMFNLNVIVNISLHNLNNDTGLRKGNASPSYLRAVSSVEDDDVFYNVLDKLIIIEENMTIVDANCDVLSVDSFGCLFNNITIKDSRIDTVVLADSTQVSHIHFINTNTTLVSNILFEGNNETYGKPVGLAYSYDISYTFLGYIYNKPNRWANEIAPPEFYNDRRVPAFDRIGLLDKCSNEDDISISLSADEKSTVFLIQYTYNLVRLLHNGDLKSCRYDAVKFYNVNDDAVTLLTCKPPISYYRFKGDMKNLLQRGINSRTLKDLVDMKNECMNVKGFELIGGA